MNRLLSLGACLLAGGLSACAQHHPLSSATTRPAPTRVLVITSRAKDHTAMMAAAAPMLQSLAVDNNWVVTITNDDSILTDETLARTDVFVPLQAAPFDLKPSEQAAVERFVEHGGGWVGIHAAGLTGKQFLGPGSPYWQWFEDFMGGVIYSPHPKFQQGTLIIEDRTHPATCHLPAKMDIGDEWYEFDHSPRGSVRVLARADESTYKQNKPMGDHPLIWTNEKYRRMIYIGIGHSDVLCANRDFITLVRDSITWAGSN